MAAHACLSVLAPGGRLVVYGGNDEGIRSAAGMIERLCGGVETLATRGHGRVVAAHRPADPSQLRASLAAWRSTDVAGDRRQPARLGLLPRHLRRRPHRRGHRAADRRAAAAARRRPRARLRMRIGRDRRQRGRTCARHRARPAGQRQRGAGSRARERARRAARARRVARRSPAARATTPSCPTRRCTRGSPRTTRSWSSSSPTRRRTCSPAASCRSWCSAACRSTGCWPSTSPPSPSPPRPAAIACGGPRYGSYGNAPKKPQNIRGREIAIASCADRCAHEQAVDAAWRRSSRRRRSQAVARWRKDPAYVRNRSSELSSSRGWSSQLVIRRIDRGCVHADALTLSCAAEAGSSVRRQQRRYDTA